MDFKGFLNWISGGSKPPEVPKQESRAERRRYARVGLEDCDISLQGKGPFPVDNISFGGIRVKLPDPLFLGELQPGAKLSGKIRLQAIHTQITLTVCNKFPDGVGCSFTDLTPSQSRMFSDFIKPRILGISIQEVASSALQNREPNMKMRWFQGDEGTQIFLWQSLQGEVVTEEYYFLNYVISWDKDQKTLKTGYIRDDSGKTGFGRIDPKAVVFFNVPSHRALKLGKTILENSSLPPEAKDRLMGGILQEERRLFSRYILQETDRSLKFFTDSSRTRYLSIANISFRGVSLVLAEGEKGEEFIKGKTISGEINLGEDFVPAKIRIVFRRDQSVGGTLEVAGEKNLEALAQYLAPRLLGQSLEEAPTAVEELPFVPAGARCYLFLGLHNTHVMAVIRPGGGMVMGRIVYMDQVLVFDRKTLTSYRCPSGIIFPRDWDLPPENLQKEGRVSDFCRYISQEMIQAGTLPEEVRKAWIEILGPPKPQPDSKTEA